MFSITRRAAWIPFAALLIASPAFALKPSPTASTVDPVIVALASVVLPFHVVVRDATGTPIPGSNVSLHLISPVHAYNTQNPPLVVSCPDISLTADPTGTAVFSGIRFGGFVNAQSIQVIADGTFIRSAMARSGDVNDDGDVNLVDFAAFQDAFLHHPTTTPQFDFDNDGTVNLPDLNGFRQAYIGSVHGTNCP